MVIMPLLHPSLYCLINNILMYCHHVLNSADALLILRHAAIQVVYCHYMLTSFVECMWYVKFLHLCLNQEDKSIE